MKKFDKIRRLKKDEGATFRDDEFVYVEEKIDGACFRTCVDENNELRFGSRTVEFMLETDESFEGYGAFSNTVEYIKGLDVNFYKGYIYFFEGMIKHTLNYNFSEHPKAVLLDIYDVDNDLYLSRNKVEEFTLENNLEVTPLLFTGMYKDFNHEIPDSKYGNFKAEGFVIKPLVSSRDKHGNIHRAKVVGDKFREEKKEVWGESNDKESAFAIRFTTPARIDKEIHKLETNLNIKIEPKHIGVLTYNILKDICDEEFKRLLKMKTPNLGIIRAEVQRQIKLRLGQLGVL